MDWNECIIKGFVKKIRMKKIIITGLLFLLLFSFVVALEEPNASIGSEQDVEKIEEVISQIPIDGETGKINYDKFKPFETDFEKRIDDINLLLEENASWLKIVFGMVPSISLLFFINLYILLIFFITLILNANATFGIFESLGQKMGFFEFSWANLLGSAIFIILLITKVFVKLSNFVYGLWDIFWNYILPWGFAIAIIIAIVTVLIFIVLLRYAPQVLLAIKKGIDKKKEEKATTETALNREVLEKIVTSAIQP
ncbi:hypothetical protein KAI32_03880 [Candidatus Pacearchaeota archaeon]|nr:hypothetical protein [Candidatus Pacearchaeota archaeon]